MQNVSFFYRQDSHPFPSGHSEYHMHFKHAKRIMYAHISDVHVKLYVLHAHQSCLCVKERGSSSKSSSSHQPKACDDQPT